MGRINGWRCRSCGKQETFLTGSGFLSYDFDETRELVAQGGLGSIARALLSADSPVDVHVDVESVVYRCPSCGKLVQGSRAHFVTEDDPVGLVRHWPPKHCPVCDKEFARANNRMPVPDKEVHSYINFILEAGCPMCGSPNMEPVWGNWD